MNPKYYKWHFPVPPACTGGWDGDDWDRWIEKHGVSPENYERTHRNICLKAVAYKGLDAVVKRWHYKNFI